MLGYRTTFAVDVTQSTGIEAGTAIDTLLREGFDWLRRRKGLLEIDGLEPWVEKSFPNGSRAIYGKGATPSGDEYAKLVYFDRPQPTGQWVTTLLVGRSKKKQGLLPLVSVEIDAPEDPAWPGRPIFPNRPWLVKNILDGYACYDRGMRTSDDPIQVSDEEGVAEFLRNLEDERHRGLIIACGTDGTVEAEAWKRILDDITTECAGQATVYQLTPRATEMVNARVSEKHALTPYALRTFKPGAVLDDPTDGLRHRVLSARALLGKNKKELTRMFGRVSREHSRALPPDPFMRRLDAITGAELDRVTFERTEEVRAAIRASTLQAREDRAIEETGAAPAVDGASLSLEAVVRTEAVIAEAPTSEAIAAGEVEMLRIEVEDLRARLVEARSEAAKARDENERMRAELALSCAKYERLSDAHAHDRDRLGRVHEAEIADLNARLEDKTLEVEIQLEARQEAEKEARRARYDLDLAKRELLEAGLDTTPLYLEKEDPYAEASFSNWEELEAFGADVFPRLVLSYDTEAAESLAQHGRSLSWLRETCDILAMLDEYAAFRASDEGRGFRGGLHQYLRGGAPAGARLIPAVRLRDSESETSVNMWGDERRFKVPESVDPSGFRTMLAHIEIQHFKSVSPRLYFEDRTGDLGKVVIGYIGRHLTNTKSG